MFVRRVALLVAAAFVMIAAPRDASAVNKCCVPGQACVLHDANNLVFDAAGVHCPNNNFCGCTVSGENCKLHITSDLNTSTTDCLTLGAGVTFDLEGHALHCTGSDCGLAIHNTDSAGASSKVVIKNGTISGCFDAAVYVDGGSDSSVADLNIDLGASCTNGLSFQGGAKSVGIIGLRGTIATTQVHHTNVGVMLNSGEDIVDSVLSDNVHGLIGGTSTSAIDNVLFADNSAAHIWEYHGTFDPDIIGSSFIGATTCNCSLTLSGQTTETCQSSLRSCGTFAAPPSHVCEPADSGSNTCSIED